MIDRKEVYKNVRRAYRLLYEVQDSLVEMVEYIRSRIRYVDCAGRQIFSAPISNRKSDVDNSGAKQNFGQGMWSWDYLPAYMYLYYFQTPSDGDRNTCFNIVQVMDDGAEKELRAVPPSPSKFRSVNDSESYVLLAFSIWKNNHRAIWFDGSEDEGDKDIRNEVFRLADNVRKEDGTLIITSERHPEDYFIIMKINLESLGNREEAAKILHEFAQFVKSTTGYFLLPEE